MTTSRTWYVQVRTFAFGDPGTDELQYNIELLTHCGGFRMLGATAGEGLLPFGSVETHTFQT